MKLISTYEKIERRTVYDCRIKSIMELMRHYGLVLTSFEILLICRAITFNYDRVVIPGILENEVPYGTVSTDKIEEVFFKSLEIRYVEQKIGDSIEDWAFMKSLIDKDIPIMFKIDSRFLNKEYKKSGKLNLYYLSTLLLVGYEEETQSVLVVLMKTSEKDTVTKISIDDFQTYRNTDCMPEGADYRCYYLPDDCGVNEVTKKKIRQEIWSGLREIVEHMLDKSVLENMKYGAFIGTEQTVGIQGMKSLKSNLEELIRTYKTGSETDKKLIKLMLIFIRNNLLFGSHTAFRSEFAACLKMCHEKYGFEYTLTASNKFYEVSKKWMNFFAQLSGIAHKNDDISELFSQTIETLESIIEIEEEQYLKLSEKLCHNYIK